MAPLLRPRYSLSKDKFPAYFGPLKSQSYNDTTSGPRGGGGSHHRYFAYLDYTSSMLMYPHG